MIITFLLLILSHVVIFIHANTQSAYHRALTFLGNIVVSRLMVLNSSNRQKWIDFILLNSFSCNSAGLYYGKSGISLTLFELAAQQQNDSLEDYALELLQESLITQNTDVRFSNGLAGIGFVLHYLITAKRLEGDFLELFGEKHAKIVTSIHKIGFASNSVKEYADILFYIDLPHAGDDCLLNWFFNH